MSAVRVRARARGEADAQRPPLGRSFGYLWGASGSSNLGDGILMVGAPLLAVTVTRSPLLISVITALVWLPWLLFALHAGAIADRYDRRRIMAVASWTRAVVLAAVAVVTAVGGVSLPVLYVTVLVVGTAEVFSDTSAQSLLPAIVERDQLGTANGRLIAVQTVANYFLGAPVAGVLVGIAATWVFGAAGLCFAVAGLLLLRIRGHRPAERKPTTMRSEIRAGLRFLLGHRVLRNLAVVAGVENLAGNAYMAVLVLWVVNGPAGPGAAGAESAVGHSPAQYGLFVGVVGVGAVLGSLLVERVTRAFGAARSMLWLVVGQGILLLVPVIFPAPAPLYVTGLAIGAAGAAINVIVVSMRQRLIPGEILGRVNASYRLIGMGGIPAGALAGGVLGEVAGLAAVLYTAAGVWLATAIILAVRVSPSAVARAEGETSGQR